MRHYLITVDGKEFEITLAYRAEPTRVICNGQELDVSSHILGESRSLLLIDGQSHEVDVRSNGYESTKTVFMRGMEIPVQIEDYNLAQLRKTAGMTTGAAMDKTLRAAMPGLVLEIRVKPGETVKKGQPLLIIEAMKMENIIKAQGEGTIKSILVESGKSVEKNDKLLEFE